MQNFKDVTTPNSVSIPKARRILGARYKQLSDDQIRFLIHDLQLLAFESLVYNGSKINEGHDEEKSSRLSSDIK